VRDNLHRIIEAILFASDAPLSAQKLKELISGAGIKDIRDAIEYLNRQYEAGGNALKIIGIAGGYLTVTREEYASYLQKLYKGRTSSRLTQRALETLSIVAYKQPITKQEIEAIRGVNVDAVMKTLLERNLISIEGRQKAPGSPLLYGTTKYFLEYFALNSLEALPKLKEIDELLRADDKFLESLDQVALHKLAPESLGLKNPEELSGESEYPDEQPGKQIPLIVFEKEQGTAPTGQKSRPEEEAPPAEQPAGEVEKSESGLTADAGYDRSNESAPAVEVSGGEGTDTEGPETGSEELSGNHGSAENQADTTPPDQQGETADDAAK
jgi:segregation and condensation protein B